MSAAEAGTPPKVGLVSLGDLRPDPTTDVLMSESARVRQLIDLAVHAEELGMDSIHLGEHHFNDYIVSSPTPILAAIAERTSRIRLSTAVSLLPNHDPVRIAEDYATVDCLSGGRVELIAGKGVEPGLYRQYGLDAAAAEDYLREAVLLLRRLWTEERVSWKGNMRPELVDVTVRPRPQQRPHPLIWLSASSAGSVERAVTLGCPIVIATPSVGRAAPARLAAEYRSAWAAAGRDPQDAQVMLHVHCHVGRGSSPQIIERWTPYQMSYMRWFLDQIRPDVPLPDHHQVIGQPISSSVCGNPEDVAADINDRIAAMGGVDGVLIQCDSGGLPPALVEESVTTFMQDVAPALSAAGSPRR